MLAIGPDHFREMLAGFHEMDVHFRTTPLERNLPALLGLVGLWNRNFLGCDTVAFRGVYVTPPSTHADAPPADFFLWGISYDIFLHLRASAEAGEAQHAPMPQERLARGERLFSLDGVDAARQHPASKL